MKRYNFKCQSDFVDMLLQQIELALLVAWLEENLHLKLGICLLSFMHIKNTKKKLIQFFGVGGFDYLFYFVTMEVFKQSLLCN